MAESKHTLPLARHRLIPRSIKGLMLLTLFAAVIFSNHAQYLDGSAPFLAICESLFLVIACVFAGGLIQQAAFYWRHGREVLAWETRESCDPEVRWAIGVAICSRLAVAMMLVGSAGVRGLMITNEAAAGRWSSDEFQLIWRPLLPIWLLVAMTLTRQARRLPRPPRIWHGVVSLVAGTAATALVIGLVAWGMLVPFLVFVAIRGLEMRRGGPRTPLLPGHSQHVIERLEPAFWLTFASLIAFAAAAFALSRYSRNLWPRASAESAKCKPLRANLYLGIACVCTLAMTALLVVNVRDALPNAMPWIMAEPFSYSYTEMAVSGLPLVLLVSFALTARITRQRPALQAANEAEDLGRKNDSLVMPVCWHERPVLLVCSSLMALVYALIEIKSSINWVFASNQTMSWRDALDWAIGQPGLVFELLFLIDPYMPGNVCLVFLTVMGFGLVLAWRGRKKRMPKFSVSLPRYGSAGGFLFVFLLITLLVILGALQLCLTGFMIDATDLVL